MSDFNEELAMSLLKDENDYPVNLDEAWQWLGYAKKHNAKEKLVNNFEEGIDYIIPCPQEREVRPQGGFSSREDIYLTVDCFKQLGMMAGTSKGKEVRRYFLDCEKMLKQQMLKFNQLAISEQVVVQLTSFIEEQRKLNADLMHRTKRLDALEQASSKHPGFRNIIEGEMELTNNTGLTVKSYCQARNVILTRDKAIQMGQIASAAYKLDKKEDPKKVGSAAVYFGNDVKYLDEAFDKVTKFNPQVLELLDEEPIF